MADIIVPSLGESVKEALVARWMKMEGDLVTQDEPLVELETDKVTLEVNASHTGTLKEIKAPKGAKVSVGSILGFLEVTELRPPLTVVETQKTVESLREMSLPIFSSERKEDTLSKFSPAALKLATEKDVDPSTLQGTGKDQRITKGDVLAALKEPQKGQEEMTAPQTSPPHPTPLFPTTPSSESQPIVASAPSPSSASNREERVRMSPLRLRIAERLLLSQHHTATLTTFNEIDMTQVTQMRHHFKDLFEKKYGIRLGFMSFFVKAAIVALKEIPAVNAEIDGTDVIYKKYYDIGVAVGTPHGLVVPVIRNADEKSFSEVEQEIASLALKARDRKLSLSEMTGGTFTLSNGGVYGSLLSTPILNPPQSGILGMHKVEQRPVAIDGKVEIRPMMYVALSYDHRLIDGTESVTFLKRVKECIENPERIMLEL